jgi:hypothetical protein
VNIAAQKSALNTWICVIVRRAAESMLADATKFDAADAETVASIADAGAAMGVPPGKGMLRLCAGSARVRVSARCAGDERT